MRRRRCGCWRGSTALALDDERLLDVALETGADVPVCLASQACDMTGVGESLLPLNLPKLPCVMVNPRVPVATKDVFTALGLRNGELLVGATDVLESPAWPDGGAIGARLGRGARDRAQRSRSARDAHPARDRRGALRARQAPTACCCRGCPARARPALRSYGDDADARSARPRRSGAITRNGGCMRAC